MNKRKRKWRTKKTVRRGLVEVSHYKGREEKRMEQLKRLVCGRASDKDVEVTVTYPKSAEAEAKAEELALGGIGRQFFVITIGHDKTSFSPV